MTWNVWGRFGDWRRREAALLAIISAAQPDVLALQETWSTPRETQAARLGAELGLYATFARSRMPDDSDPEVELGLAVLSRWPLSAVRRHRLPSAAGSQTVALQVEAEHPEGPLHVMTTCLDWEEDHAQQRRRQVRALRSLLADPRLDGPLPVALAGDLNAPPDTPEIADLTASMTDCWAHSATQSARSPGQREPGHTYSSANPHLGHGEWLEDGRIDYVLARPGKQPVGDVAAAGVRVHDAWLAGLPGDHDPVPSDHYAVVVDLEPHAPG
jgi:endonuclease/exonuclease/phosphatase family metal-dependent hydrolase